MRGQRCSHHQRCLSAGVSRPVGESGAGVVHAPSRAVAARVSGHPGGGVDAGHHRPPGGGYRNHPSAGAPLRSRRGHLVFRHRGAHPRHRIRSGHRAWGGAGGGEPVPRSPRPQPAAPAGSGGRYALCAGNRPQPGGGTRRAADRLRRGTVHHGLVLGGRRTIAHPRPHQATDAQRSRVVVCAVGTPGRTGHRLHRLAA